MSVFTSQAEDMLIRYADINQWKGVFGRFDRDRSGTIAGRELVSCLPSISFFI